MRGGKSSLTRLGLRTGETAGFVIRGRCMAPLCDGTTVQVKAQHGYVPGDVIVVRRAGAWIAHRFLGYAPSRHGVVALTQADDASVPDPAVPTDAIVGRALCPVRIADRFDALVGYAWAVIRRLVRGS